MDLSATPLSWRAREAGAVIMSDMSPRRSDPATAEVVAKAKAGLILMHMQGAPATMQDHPTYTAVVEEVSDFLRSRVEAAVAAGIEVERIAVDPGFGFGKTSDHNLALLGSLPALRVLDRPIVIGPSRKSFVGGILGRSVEEREWGTAAAVAVGVFQGAHVVRAHSVAQMRDVTRVAQALRDAGRAPDRRYSFSAS